MTVQEAFKPMSEELWKRLAAFAGVVKLHDRKMERLKWYNHFKSILRSFPVREILTCTSCGQTFLRTNQVQSDENCPDCELVPIFLEKEEDWLRTYPRRMYRGMHAAGIIGVMRPALPVETCMFLGRIIPRRLPKKYLQRECYPERILPPQEWVRKYTKRFGSGKTLAWALWGAIVQTMYGREMKATNYSQAVRCIVDRTEYYQTVVLPADMEYRKLQEAYKAEDAMWQKWRETYNYKRLPLWRELTASGTITALGKIPFEDDGSKRFKYFTWWLVHGVLDVQRAIGRNGKCNAEPSLNTIIPDGVLDYMEDEQGDIASPKEYILACKDAGYSLGQALTFAIAAVHWATHGGRRLFKQLEPQHREMLKKARDQAEENEIVDLIRGQHAYWSYYERPFLPVGVQWTKLFLMASKSPLVEKQVTRPVLFRSCNKANRKAFASMWNSRENMRDFKPLKELSL